MDRNENAELIARRFTALAREGKTEEAIEYYLREAHFPNGARLSRSDTSNMQTPPMNELYKGIKD